MKEKRLPTTYYVSVQGKDENDGSSRFPWKTLQKAADTAGAGDTVIICEGIYRETVTIKNSGTKEHPLIFKAHENHKVVINGTELLTGWAAHDGRIYKTEMSWDLGVENQVFADGEMMNLARWPNKTDDNLLSLKGTAVVDRQKSSSTRIYCSSMPEKPDNYWKGSTVWCLADNKWTAWANVIKGSGRNYIEMDIPGDEWVPKYHDPSNSVGGDDNYFYISNKFEELDSEKEWFYDSDNCVIYLWAPGGVNPSTITVEAKKRMWAIDFNSKSFVSFIGIDVFGAGILMNGTHCTIERMNASYLYHHRGDNMGHSFPGKSFSQGFIIAGSHNTVRNSILRYSCTYGIYCEGEGNIIDNNEIYHMDYLGNYGTAVSGRGGVRITRNKIWYCGSPGIGMGGERKNFIAYNDVGFCDILGDDRGGINGSMAEVCYNWVHDIGIGLARGVMPGIYHDDRSSSVTTHHNVIFNTKGKDGMLRVGGVYGTVRFYNNTGFNCPSEFSIATHNDGTYIEANNIYNLPEENFKDARNGDFRLSEDSPAIDAGVEVPPYTDGFAGRAPDLGAYEKGGSPAVSEWRAGIDVTMYYDMREPGFEA